MRRILTLVHALLLLTALHAQKTTDTTASRLSYGLLEKIRTAATDSLTVSVRVRDQSRFLARQLPIRFIRSVPSVPVMILRLKASELRLLAASPEVEFINEYFMPREELTTGAYDLSLNSISYVHARLPQLAGDSLKVSVKERMFDTADIDLKGRIFTTGLEASTQTSHAAIMATMIAGGANTSPFAKGAAWKSSVSSASFLQLFADADSIFQKHRISLQNHSYGTIVENLYGNEAASYDAQANRLSALLHVFSAGNSGTATTTAGPYAGVAEYANLTGNYKHAKNILTVGSVDSAAQRMLLSSRGPAYDGRVKPEIMAYGEDGSSGAAALVSGAALLVQDAYRSIRNGDLPSSALVKAVLVNSADDIGKPQVDYASGFGNLNAYKAVHTIRSGRFYEDQVATGETRSVRLHVPAGLSRFKITMAWNDPAASPNAVKALIHDLDLEVKNVSTGETWKPWILNPSSTLAALESNAVRGTDTLNNVEQVTIDLPMAGDYDVQVTGSRIWNDAQGYSIAYQMDSAEIFYWTLPASGDPLIPGRTHWLRWDTDIKVPGEIEYSLAPGNWMPVANLADPSRNFFRWMLPDTTGLVVLRMRIPSTGRVFVSDTFTLSAQLNMKVGFNCPDSFLLYWNHLPAGNYRLYEMGAAYLQPFLHTSDTVAVLNKLLHPSLYYSVAPLINGKEGIKSNTIHYAAQAVDCYIKSFYLHTQAGGAAHFRAELGSLFQVTQIGFEKLGSNGFINLKTIEDPADLSFIFSDSLMHQGENRYRIRLKLRSGSVLYSTTELVYFLPEAPVLVYPNPVAQQGSIKVITNESGRYTLQAADNNGRVVYQKLLTSNITHIHAGRFGKGLYFMRILDRDGKPFTQKLVVY